MTQRKLIIIISAACTLLWVGLIAGTLLIHFTPFPLWIDSLLTIALGLIAAETLRHYLERHVE